MPKRSLLTISLLFFLFSLCDGQQISWQASSRQLSPSLQLNTLPKLTANHLSASFQRDSSFLARQKWRDGYQILPSYARENPSGYSFLCRLELEAEDKLPIGMWVKADGGGQSLVPRMPQTYVQFKLLRF